LFNICVEGEATLGLAKYQNCMEVAESDNLATRWQHMLRSVFLNLIQL
jgi:hypothetical protein